MSGCPPLFLHHSRGSPRGQTCPLPSLATLRIPTVARLRFSGLLVPITSVRDGAGSAATSASELLGVAPRIPEMDPLRFSVSHSGPRSSLNAVVSISSRGSSLRMSRAHDGHTCSNPSLDNPTSRRVEQRNPQRGHCSLSRSWSRLCFDAHGPHRVPWFSPDSGTPHFSHRSVSSVDISPSPISPHPLTPASAGRPSRGRSSRSAHTARAPSSRQAIPAIRAPTRRRCGRSHTAR